MIRYIFLISVLFTLGGCAMGGPNLSDTPPIVVESVRTTAAGHYLDLRYRVLDPVRANEALGPGSKPTLVADATGAVMAVPTTAKLGSLRQTNADQRLDRTYFVLFLNSAGVRAGSKVTAHLGGFTFDDLSIQ